MRKTTWSRVLGLGLVLALALCAGTAQAATWYVTPTGSGDGSSWVSASADLRGVLTAASAGDAVWVAKGTYSPGPASEDTFLLKKGLKVYGGFLGGEATLEARDWKANGTILDGRGINAHVVTGGTDAASDDTTLDGFTVTGGNAVKGGGGGMYNSHSSPAVAHCVFKGNNADDGGGMLNSSSSPTVAYCTFEGNTAARGGGMLNVQHIYSIPAVVHCVFRRNTAVFGGGMQNSGSHVTVTHCTFEDNTSTYSGGGP